MAAIDALSNATGRLDFGAVFDRLPDAVLIADDDGRYVYANPAAATLLGLPLPELLQRGLHDIAGDSAEAESGWASFRREGRQSGEFSLRHPDGYIVPVEFNAVADYQPGLHLSVLRDISDRKRLEDSLRRSEERFVRTFLALPVPTNVRLLATGVFTEVNEAFISATGYWRSEILGGTGHSLGLWTDPTVLDDLLTELREGALEVRTRAQLRLKDGSVRDFAVAMRQAEIRDEAYVVAAFWDLTDL